MLNTAKITRLNRRVLKAIVKHKDGKVARLNAKILRILAQH